MMAVSTENTPFLVFNTVVEMKKKHWKVIVSLILWTGYLPTTFATNEPFFLPPDSGRSTSFPPTPRKIFDQLRRKKLRHKSTAARKISLGASYDGFLSRLFSSNNSVSNLDSESRKVAIKNNRKLKWRVFYVIFADTYSDNCDNSGKIYCECWLQST